MTPRWYRLRKRAERQMLSFPPRYIIPADVNLSPGDFAVTPGRIWAIPPVFDTPKPRPRRRRVAPLGYTRPVRLS